MGAVIRPQQSHVQDFVLGPGKDFHLDFMFPGGKHLQGWLVIHLIQCQTNEQTNKTHVVLEVLCMLSPPGIKELVCFSAPPRCEMGTFFRGAMTKLP